MPPSNTDAPLPILDSQGTTAVASHTTRLSIGLTFLGVGAPVVSVILLADVLQIWHRDNALPFRVQFGVVLLSMAVTGVGVALGWKQSARYLYARIGLVLAVLWSLLQFLVGIFLWSNYLMPGRHGQNG